MAKSVLSLKVILIIICLSGLFIQGCKSTGAVCPKSEHSKVSDLSLLNKDKKSKERKKKKPDNGLVGKKQPSRLNK